MQPNYGEALKMQRKISGYTQEQLSKATGIVQPNISAWENNIYTPSIDFCVQLANFYGITLEELLGLEDEFGVKTHNEINVATTYSAEERRLVDYFRQLSPNMQRIALNTLQGMSGGSEDSLHNKA